MKEDVEDKENAGPAVEGTEKGKSGDDHKQRRGVSVSDSVQCVDADGNVAAAVLREEDTKSAVARKRPGGRAGRVIDADQEARKMQEQCNQQ